MKTIEVDEMVNQAKYWVKCSRKCMTLSARRVYIDMALGTVAILSYIEINRKYSIGVYDKGRFKYYDECYKKYYEMIFE